MKFLEENKVEITNDDLAIIEWSLQLYLERDPKSSDFISSAKDIIECIREYNFNILKEEVENDN